jgi:hypothetical protein
MLLRKNQKFTYTTFITVLITISLVIVFSIPTDSVTAANLAQTAPTLGAAGSYSVLAGTTVTNTGGTTMPGDLGVSPGSAVTGFPPGSVGPPGTIRTITAAGLAQSDADVARLALEAQGPGTNVGNELNGLTLNPGVYTVPGVSLLSGGTLTLDGDGVYIFLTNGLTSTGTVSLINGASACDVYWRDASSVTIGEGSFVGTIIALTSISMGNSASLQGRAIAQNGAVTLDTNSFTGAECLTEPIEPTPTSTTNPTAGPTTGPTTGTTTPAPEVLPDTGGNLTGTQTRSTQIIRIGLGVLGVALVLFAFLLFRNKHPLKNKPK